MPASEPKRVPRSGQVALHPRLSNALGRYLRGPLTDRPNRRWPARGDAPARMPAEPRERVWSRSALSTISLLFIFDPFTCALSSCIPKQLDSSKELRTVADTPSHTGFSPSMTSRSRALRWDRSKRPLRIPMRTPKEPAFNLNSAASLAVTGAIPRVSLPDPRSTWIKIRVDRQAPAGPTERVTNPIRSRTGRSAAAALWARPRDRRTDPDAQAVLEGSNDARTGMPPEYRGRNVRSKTR
ncbi:hypothetical protein N7530_012996 [Penicillium desertorum]|uniref:Uncharacterized protein n=1 Tax=Penicillium desertorum TaxID=1303715 RepID=A0A9W9WCN7_9EURO|nr:hypothetical protein N7530_012996 [Penicillium desertorum]